MRTYIDLLIYDVVGYNTTQSFAQELLHTRWSPAAEAQLPPLSAETYSRLCERESVLTSQALWEDLDSDVRTVAPHFRALPPVLRDWQLSDYVEHVVGDVLGLPAIAPFLRRCFRGQGYRRTEPGTPEHDLWRQK